ncbi:MAG: hypothetical protein PHS92_05405 [Candidatus Gracilibacteria bacterium]|nr:hypothetical protein [Candidatus Gracilibacteria bacterium]
MRKSKINMSILAIGMLNILLFGLSERQDISENKNSNNISTGNKRNLSLNKADENQCKNIGSLKQNKEIIFVGCNDFYE